MFGFFLGPFSLFFLQREYKGQLEGGVLHIGSPQKLKIFSEESSKCWYLLIDSTYPPLLFQTMVGLNQLGLVRLTDIIHLS